jgi:uncharacterized iron-regulated membrane protein
MLWLLVMLGAAGIVFALIWWAALRYARREKRLGKWDKYGPLVETEPPPHPPRSGLMSWHLEVAGKWKGKVLRQREPDEKP